MTRLVVFVAFWVGSGVIPVLSPWLQAAEDPRIRALVGPVASLGPRGAPTVLHRDIERTPVLIVPGWSDQAGDVEPLRQRFVDAGWPEPAVGVVGFQNPFGSNESHAREVAVAVQFLQESTGAGQVDVVAHSMGGLATRYFLHFENGSESVRRVVFLGTPHRGTVAAVLAWGDGGREMVPGSPFLEKLNSQDPVPLGVDVLAVRTSVDLRVIPASSAILPGAENVEVCCPTHAGMVDDDRTFQEVLGFLQRASKEGIGGS